MRWIGCEILRAKETNKDELGNSIEKLYVIFQGVTRYIPKTTAELGDDRDITKHTRQYAIKGNSYQFRLGDKLKLQNESYDILEAENTDRFVIVRVRKFRDV